MEENNASLAALKSLRCPVSRKISEQQAPFCEKARSWQIYLLERSGESRAALRDSSNEAAALENQSI